MELSIVVPVRDERDNLEPLVDEIASRLVSAVASFEILLIDDGSTDGSSERIAELAASRERLRGVYLRRHAGQSAAIDAGFKAE